MKKFLFASLLAVLLCIPLVQLRADVVFFNEGFEGGSIPSGWTQEGNGTWIVGTGVGGSYPSTTYDGNSNASISHSTTDNVSKLISPVIDLSGQTSVVLTFAYVNQPWGGDVDGLAVYYRSDATDSWHQIDAFTAGTSVWTEAEYTLTAGLTSTYQLAFEYTDHWGHGAGVDEINIGLPATCFPPTDLTVSNITSTTADFSWMASGQGESQYQCVCIPADSTLDWTNVPATYFTTEYASNLQPNTNYIVYVRSYCSATDQSKKISATFKTFCAPVAIENVGTISFETSEGYVSGSGNLENCWTVYNLQNPTNTSYIPYVQANGTWAGSDYAHTGIQCLSIYAYSSSYTVADSAIAVMPDYIFTPDMSGYELHFYMRKQSTSSYSSYNDTLWVGVMSDPTDISTLQIIGSAVNTTTTYQKYIVSLSNYVGTTGNIVFLAAVDLNASQSYKYASFYVDDITIVETRNTPTPTDVAVDNITMTTVDVSFTSAAANNRILMATEVVADPETYTNWTIDTVVSTNPATINVESATTYWLFVQGIGTVDSSFISNPAVKFESACDIIATFPWSENFDTEVAGEFAKVCWVNEHVSGTGSYLAYIMTSGMGDDNPTPILNFKDQYGPTYTRVQTPEFNIPAADTYEFRISVYRSNSYTEDDYKLEGVTVVVENNYGGYDSTFIPRIYSERGNVGDVAVPNTWYTYTISLPKAGVQRIQLLGCNNNGQGTYVDNLLVRKTPTCTKVQNVTVRDNQPTQATIGWDLATGAKYQVLFTSERINPDTLANVDPSKILFNDSTPAADDSLIVTGLTVATKYFVYVRSLCSDEMSDWSDYVAFRTACQILNITRTTPYTYGFEDLDDNTQDVPCWNLIQSNMTNNYPCVSSSNYYTGSKCWYGGGYNGGNDTTYLIMPEMINNVNTLRLRFYMRGFNYAQYNDSIVVGVIVDPADETTFVGYDTIVAPDENYWYRYEFLFDEYTGPEGRIAIKRIPVLYRQYQYVQYYGSAFDDFTLDLIPTCKAVKDVAAKDITTQSATITWTATTAPSYNVVVADTAINPLDTADATLAHIIYAGSVAGDSVNVASLNPLTAYYAYVQADCGAGDYSEFTEAYSFSTAADLPYVQYISGNDHPAELSWYVAALYGMDSVLAGVDNLRALAATSSSWYMNNHIGGDTVTLKINLYGTTNGGFATPVLEFNGTDSVELSFDICKRAYNSSNAASDNYNDDDYFYVMLADPTMTQFTMLASWGNDTLGMRDYSLRNDLGKDFTHVTVDMSELQGAYRVFFYAGSYNFNDDYDFHIDNIMIGTPAEVVAIPNDTARGVVTGSCQTVVGTQVSLIAYPNDGYFFYQWSDGVTSQYNIHTVASENDTLVAYFFKDSVDWVITSNDETMGTVTGSGRYAAFDTVTISATANTGFEFISWSDGNTDAVRTFIATEDLNLVATFDTLIVNFTFASADSTMGLVAAVCDNDTLIAGNITGASMYGTEFVVYAIANDGYKFTGWSNGETADHITVVLTSDVTITANFESTTTGVENVEAAEYVAYAEGYRINVVGADNHAVSVIDATGRVIANVEKANRDEHFTVNVPGVYFIRVNGMKSTSVVVK